MRRGPRHAAPVDESGVTLPLSSPSTPSPSYPLLERQEAKQREQGEKREQGCRGSKGSRGSSASRNRERGEAGWGDRDDQE